MTPAALGPTCPWCLTEDHPEHGCAGSAAGDPECCKPYAERRVRHGLDRVILDIRRGMSGYAVHAQAWGDVRPEGTATTQASVPAALWKVAKVATSVDVAELVGSLLAAPVTEPASVAELREARQRAERQRDVAERGLADAHDVLATLRTERDEARAQLDALREAAERFLVDDANGVTETAGLVAALADTAGAAQERAAADARAVERIRSRAEVEGDHCYPGQPAREAAWADRALESEARQAERDAVALTDAEAYEIVASVRGRRER